MIRQAALGRRSPTYGSEGFDALTDLAWQMADNGRSRTAIVTATRDPFALRHVWAVLRLPTVEVRAPAHELQDWKTNRYLPALGTRYSGRRAQAVLVLPTSQETYTAGRHRQALRTNATRARALGITARPVADYEEWTASASAVLSRRPGGAEVVGRLATTGPGGRVRLHEATTTDGEVVAVAGSALVGDAACLMALISVPDHPAAAPTRYLLHSTMVGDLISLGQRHLVVGSALRQTAGLQYFQHLLGYRLANLHLTRTDTARHPALVTPPERQPVRAKRLQDLAPLAARRSGLAAGTDNWR